MKCLFTVDEAIAQLHLFVLLPVISLFVGWFVVSKLRINRAQQASKYLCSRECAMYLQIFMQRVKIFPSPLQQRRKEISIPYHDTAVMIDIPDPLRIKRSVW